MENSVLSHGLTARVTGSEEGADGSGTFVKFVVQSMCSAALCMCAITHVRV
jgi:hypothetical protein